MNNQFTHLHNHTHYSLLDGLSKIPELLDHAKELGMDSMAITDHGNLYGVIEFYQEAKKRGIKPIIGVEAYLSNYDMTDKRPGIDDKRWHLILLAKNNTGYQNLIQLVTLSYLEGFYYKPRIDKKTLAKYAEGLIGLSGCLGGEISQLILNGQLAEAEQAIHFYKNAFGEENFYLEIQDHKNEPDQQKVNNALFDLGKKTNTPLVASCDSHYIQKTDSEAHDVLLAIQTGNKVADQKRLSLKHLDCSVRSPQEMNEIFKETPEVIENTQRIAEQCNVEIAMDEYQIPEYKPPAGETEASYLRKQCVEGLQRRYNITIPTVNDYTQPIAQQIPQSQDQKTQELIERLDYELEIIIKMQFPAYMLIIADIVNWAKDHDIVVGPGRGSAAGSLVSYVLSITNVDPIKYNLLFERFLNPDRISMPDIDLDFADTRRDEVIEYVSDKYGKNNVAQIITFGTMASRVAVRDVGRVLDISYGFCDQIAKLIPNFYSLQKALKEVNEIRNLYNTDQQAKKLIDTALQLEGVVRHASTHACGVVLTKEPLTKLVPLQHSTGDETSVVTQYEMHAIEKLGLLKMDFLGLKNLTTIENTLEQIERIYGEKIDLDAISHKDEKAFDLLKQGDTTGVFQLESSGMRRYLRDLKPNDMEDIIAMISLYRPGPMDLLPQYINRKFGREKITYEHPKLEPILKNTYGIGVYQEQMMQIAQQLANFTLAQADALRKAIGKKDAQLLKEQEQKIIQGMTSNGIDSKTAQKIWALFPPFARYGFNRSHAVCYALIAYQTAYLKAHYPTEFMVALLNADAKHLDRLSFLLEEAKEHSIEVLPPSIQESGVSFTKVKDGSVRFGLGAIKNVGTAVVEKIIAIREESGKFTSIQDFLDKTHSIDLNKKLLESLVKAGAFDELEERNTLLFNLQILLDYAREQGKIQASNQVSLFGEATNTATSLQIERAKPASKMEKSMWEKELLGFYISGHPLMEYSDVVNRSTQIKNLSASYTLPVKIAALVSSTKKITTKKGQPMLFFNVEDLSGKVEAIAFPDIFLQHQTSLIEGKILQLEGRLDAKNGEPKFLCEKIVEIA